MQALTGATDLWLFSLEFSVQGLFCAYALLLTKAPPKGFRTFRTFRTEKRRCHAHNFRLDMSKFRQFCTNDELLKIPLPDKSLFLSSWRPSESENLYRKSRQDVGRLGAHNSNGWAAFLCCSLMELISREGFSGELMCASMQMSIAHSLENKGKLHCISMGGTESDGLAGFSWLTHILAWNWCFQIAVWC